MSQSELSLGGKEKLSAGYQKGEARPNLFLGLQSCHPSCLKFDIVKSKKELQSWNSSYSCKHLLFSNCYRFHFSVTHSSCSSMNPQKYTETRLDSLKHSNNISLKVLEKSKYLWGWVCLLGFFFLLLSFFLPGLLLFPFQCYLELSGSLSQQSSWKMGCRF